MLYKYFKTHEFLANNVQGVSPNNHHDNHDMKNTFQYIVGLLGLMVPFAVNAAANNWMSSINDGALLSDLTIPGTHESATYGLSGIGKCQNDNVTQQLNNGVRYLDLRCQYEGHSGATSLSMHHGILWCGMYLDDILSQIYTFLQANPSETVVVQIKEENSNAGSTFADMVSWYIQQN